MTEVALVIFAFALVAMSFALGFVCGAFYIPRKSKDVFRVAIKNADLTPEQQEKLSRAIGQAVRA